MKARTDLTREDRPPRADGGRSSRNQRPRYACPRCHSLVAELHRVSLGNLVSYIESSVCGVCVDELRGLASDLELVEVLA